MAFLDREAALALPWHRFQEAQFYCKPNIVTFGGFANPIYLQSVNCVSHLAPKLSLHDGSVEPQEQTKFKYQ